MSSSLLIASGDTVGDNTLTGFVRTPSFNNSGEVAFHGVFDSGSGIFNSTDVVAATGDIVEGKTLVGLGSLPVINNRGDVAFFATTGDGSQLLILAAFVVPERSTLLLSAMALAVLDGSGCFGVSKNRLDPAPPESSVCG